MHSDSIMIDIETLDTVSSAVVLSIGAVLFNSVGKPGEFEKEFYAVLKTNTQKELGRTVSADTEEWWAKQGVEAQFVFEDNPRDTSVVLDEFWDFIGFGDYQIWGMGSDFDNVIVLDLFRTFSCSAPWTFRNNRCFRTWKSKFSHLAPAPRFQGVEHHALDDAKHQARHLQMINKALAEKGIPL